MLSMPTFFVTIFTRTLNISVVVSHYEGARCMI
jgi:hypothetical protein